MAGADIVTSARTKQKKDKLRTRPHFLLHRMLTKESAFTIPLMFLLPISVTM
ncbi:hypothetical protein GPEL0_01r2180 [Geoanaerobacter pelophilus]|uniref:Uncharacterized protein n=1 Tax=Geoanaerobacter pelophilus TaxID=60036 RepID=A0ABQ0MI63_9BACT|nr:hypothetical protein GPEL0_01r2180 [Geoanaerobacter pelophilus]